MEKNSDPMRYFSDAMSCSRENTLRDRMRHLHDAIQVSTSRTVQRKHVHL